MPNISNTQHTSISTKFPDQNCNIIERCNFLHFRMSKLVLFTACLFILKTPALTASNCPRSNTWPKDLTTPFGFSTFTPVNFESETARLVTTKKPFTVVVDSDDQLILNNTGSTVALTLANTSAVSKSSCTGSIFKNDVYAFYIVNFFWNQDFKGACCSSDDGQNGEPLAAGVTYFNKKYGSFKNALKFRDGIITIVLKFSVQGVEANPAFTSLLNSIKKVKTAGTSTSMSNAKASLWFKVFADAKFNYMYPGSYIQLEGSVQYPAATMIVPQLNISPYISVNQFQVFLDLLNLSGSPINAVLTSFPQNDCLPLIQVPGVSLTFT